MGKALVWVAAELVGGSIAGVVFIRRQNRMAAPMLPVDLFRKPVFALSVATSVCSYSAQTSRSWRCRSTSPCGWHVAVAYRAADHAMAGGRGGRGADRRPAVGSISGRAAGRHGLAVLTAGLLLMLALPPDPPFVDVVWRMMVCGIGFGFFQSPNNRALISAAPRSRSGVASGDGVHRPADRPDDRRRDGGA